MEAKIDLDKIGYTDEPDLDYHKKLVKVKTLKELKTLGGYYSPLFPDAGNIISGMDEKDFIAFKKGLLKERKGKFAGGDFAARYGSILVPAMILTIGAKAIELHVPFGLVFCRIRENKKDNKWHGAPVRMN